jgi:fibronectin type 3 domain-containing protein
MKSRLTILFFILALCVSLKFWMYVLADDQPAYAYVQSNPKQDASDKPHTVALSWRESPSPHEHYNVYKSPVSGHGYSKIGESKKPKYRDTAVVSGMTYYYVVTAVDSHGNESSYSDEIAAVVP